jgi:hypothetical protein
MTRLPVPLSSAEVERGFDARVREVLAVVEAFGVDPPYFNAMARALGYLGSRDSLVEPQRR